MILPGSIQVILIGEKVYPNQNILVLCFGEELEELGHPLALAPDKNFIHLELTLSDKLGDPGIAYGREQPS